ncbi:hypothetical protein [Photobacterium atrarenae]|uniref:Uncharacterized protein n=1 Tax=Photobacterium atrarenae TaxID=865757 RepID=A0ABY5GDM8_9GAMM|nr:hypothetical protein [Photobacterium atrarenae]UTV26473.1 hypothetical protein NNL38_08785 [Photobacterium atrarenae]
MSSIVIVFREKCDVGVLRDLHKLIGGSLSQTLEVIKKGKPVIEMELFDGKYDEKADLLRNLIALFKRGGVSIDIYELPSGQNFETSSLLNESRINLKTLENILVASDDEFERQLNS